MSRFLIASMMTAATLAAAPAAQAAVLQYGTTLMTSAKEAADNGSPGTGNGIVTIDTTAHTMRVEMNFTGLTTGNTAAHIHCCTAVPFTGVAGVATSVPTFIGFPTGTTAGTYDHTFNLLDATSWNPAFVTTVAGGSLATAESLLLAGLAGGTTYLNIHTTLNPGGEIRDFLHPVPEPSTWAMLVIGFGALGAAMRRRRAMALVPA